MNMYEGSRLPIAYPCNPPSLFRLLNILHFTSPPPPPRPNPFTPSSVMLLLCHFRPLSSSLFSPLPLPPLHPSICSAPFDAQSHSTLPLSPISLSPLLWITAKALFLLSSTTSLCISPSLRGENTSSRTRAHVHTCTLIHLRSRPLGLHNSSLNPTNSPSLLPVSSSPAFHWAIFLLPLEQWNNTHTAHISDYFCDILLLFLIFFSGWFDCWLKC